MDPQRAGPAACSPARGCTRHQRRSGRRLEALATCRPRRHSTPFMETPSARSALPIEPLGPSLAEERSAAKDEDRRLCACSGAFGGLLVLAAASTARTISILAALVRIRSRVSPDD